MGGTRSPPRGEKGLLLLRCVAPMALGRQVSCPGQWFHEPWPRTLSVGVIRRARES